MNFREALAQSESSGRYNLVNSEGYTGKYQFGPARLADYMKATGQQFSMDQFRDNPELQERVQAWHENDILNFITSEGLDKYIGQTVGGVPITPTAMLGMAHLGGKVGMKKFLETGGEYNPSDSNGTSLQAYGLKFSGKPMSGTSEAPKFGDLADDKKGLAGLDEAVLKEIAAEKALAKEEGILKAFSYLSKMTPEYKAPEARSTIQRGVRRDPMARFR